MTPPAPAAPFSGAVLAGGRSRRMGADKALLPGPGGRPLAAIAAAALTGAGAAEVLGIGGDGPALARLGLRPVPDHHPGEGPLGGLLTALAVASHERVVVLSCDLPLVDAAAVAAVLAGLDDPRADGAVPRAGGQLQVLLAAYRRRARPALQGAFEAGTRAVHEALTELVVAHPALPDPRAAHGADDPAALARLGAMADDAVPWLATLTGALGTDALDHATVDALLAVARDVAHGSGDRRNAPLACYALGRWVERRVAAGAAEDDALAEARALVERALGR